MKFKYKTQEELAELNPQELETYAKEKREYEALQIEEKAREVASELVKGNTGKIENLLKEIEKLQPKENAFSKDSQEFKELEKRMNDFDKSMEDLGRKTEKAGVIGKSVATLYKEKVDALKAGNSLEETDKRFHNHVSTIETKAFESLDVHSVTDVDSGDYPANGTVSAMGDTYRTIYGQILGMFRVPRVYSRIMDVVEINPLNSDRLIAFNESITSGFAITPECVEKPVSKMSLTTQTSDAGFVTSLFYTTLQIRAWYPDLVSRFVRTFTELLQEAIPNHVMAQVRANATPFTPIASLTWAAPEEFEAIVAVVTSLEKLGYNPNMIALSPVAYAKMVTQTATDGHYKLQNGSSIILVGDSIQIGSMNLTIFKDAELGDDEFYCGDAREAVKVGLDSRIFNLETDGRTDNQNAVGTSPSTGLKVNVRTHEIGQFVAVMLPDAAKGALILDTFSNVKTLVTT